VAWWSALPLALYPLAYVVVFSVANPLILRWCLAPPLPFYFLGILVGFHTVLADLARRLGRERAGAWAAGRMGNGCRTRSDALAWGAAYLRVKTNGQVARPIPISHKASSSPIHRRRVSWCRPLLGQEDQARHPEQRVIQDPPGALVCAIVDRRDYQPRCQAQHAQWLPIGTLRCE
jgi:hypothetical protein